MAGEQFELDVYKAVEEILYAEKLGIVPSCCKLFHHKGYYSKDRDSEIITDISIEIYMPNASMPHIIWVWECKDYAEPAPVRVAEEFHSKLEQIGADRTKGTLVTKNGFQRA